MTQNNKPEWFEITDADEKPELRKVSKSLPVSAVLVVALILGGGAFVTQTQNDTPASATAAVVGAAPATKLVNPSISKLPKSGRDEDDEDHEGDDD